MLFKREKVVLSHEIVWVPLPPHRGLLIKERICSLGEQILSFKSNPQIRSGTFSTIKLKNKIELQIEGAFVFLTQRKWAKTPTVSNRCVRKTSTETRIDAS